MQFQAAFPVSFRAIAGAALVLLLGTLLAACASVRPAAPAAPLPGATATPVPAESDLMAKLLAAQFALQESDLKAGAQGFADAAMLSKDPNIAEEATRLALTIKNCPPSLRSL